MGLEPKKVIVKDHSTPMGTFEVTPRCPSCYSNQQVQPLGQFYVDGNAQTFFRASCCNRIFTSEDAYSALIQKVRDDNPSSTVTYTLSNGTSVQGGTVNLNASSDSTITSIMNNTQNTSSSVQNANYTLNAIQSTLNDLNDLIRQVLEQNHKLMEKVATDPLIGMKKAINDFNLK